jgi:hypothetical protein
MRPVLHSSSFWFRLGLLIGGLALWGAPAAAQPDAAPARFETANEAYAQGQYKRAVDGYRAVLDAGQASAALYHNLGNAYVRLGRTGPAVWAYEKARQLRPEDPRLRHNLQYVRGQAGLPQGGRLARGPSVFRSGGWPLLLFWGGALALGVGLFVATGRADADQWGAWRTGTVQGAVGGGLLLLAVSVGGSVLYAGESRAVAVGDSVPVRRGPAATATADTTLPEGAVLRIRRPQGDWVRVQLRDRTAGWVPRRALRRL